MHKKSESQDYMYKCVRFSLMMCVYREMTADEAVSHVWLSVSWFPGLICCRSPSTLVSSVRDLQLWHLSLRVHLKSRESWDQFRYERLCQLTFLHQISVKDWRNQSEIDLEQLQWVNVWDSQTIQINFNKLSSTHSCSLFFDVDSFLESILFYDIKI